MRLTHLALAAAIGSLLAGAVIAQETATPPARPATNIADAMKAPRTTYSLPGLFPGKVVEVNNPAATKERKPDPAVVASLLEKGITTLTGQDMKKSFNLFFTKDDIVGIKVNPVGPGIISTHTEVVDAVIQWLTSNGLPKQNIVIWDRFDDELGDAGFTPERYPGVQIESLQTMDVEAAEGKAADDSKWLDKDGHHVSEKNFDMDVYYFVDVDGPKDKPYLNQHVFNGKYSYFGKLLTKKLTKLINVPVYKNSGNGISMATKNLGYAAVCNVGRLHTPLGYEVNTEVLAFPPVRDKLVLTIIDGLIGQYDGGPMQAAQFQWAHNTLYVGTDPFALDMIGTTQMIAKRKAMDVKVNEHPKYSEYLRYAERLGLGVTDLSKIQHVKLSMAEAGSK